MSSLSPSTARRLKAAGVECCNKEACSKPDYSVGKPRYPIYCPSCNLEDVERYTLSQLLGEGNERGYYWHIDQIPPFGKIHCIADNHHNFPTRQGIYAGADDFEEAVAQALLAIIKGEK
jgi:hypothetical protein